MMQTPPDRDPPKSDSPPHTEFGDFLRSRRQKLRLDEVGLVGGRRRRTPGLRREEVAELAGIGVDWYTRLEQGRTVTPSAATIDALARALRLGKMEHAHLRSLTGAQKHLLFKREVVPEALQLLVHSLAQPAYITGRRWDILVWNAAAADVFAEFCQLAEDDRNILVYMLTDLRARELFGHGWEQEARRMLAMFRTTHDLWADDPAFIHLVERLQKGCPEFNGWWGAHDVQGGGAGVKQLNHPTRGLLRFEYASFQANDDPALRLVIYTSV